MPPSEAAIMASIQVALGARSDCRVLRFNVGVLGSHHVRTAPTGTPDLLVLIRGGRGLWLEVKSAAGQLRPAQAAFARMCASLGWAHAVVRSVDDAKDAMEEVKDSLITDSMISGRARP